MKRKDMHLSSIETDILIDIADLNLDDLIRGMKSRDFKTVREWVIQNMDNDPYMVMKKSMISCMNMLPNLLSPTSF